MVDINIRVYDSSMRRGGVPLMVAEQGKRLMYLGIINALRPCGVQCFCPMGRISETALVTTSNLTSFTPTRDTPSCEMPHIKSTFDYSDA